MKINFHFSKLVKFVNFLVDHRSLPGPPRPDPSHSGPGPASQGSGSESGQEALAAAAGKGILLRHVPRGGPEDQGVDLHAQRRWVIVFAKTLLIK